MPIFIWRVSILRKTPAGTRCQHALAIPGPIVPQIQRGDTPLRERCWRRPNLTTCADLNFLVNIPSASPALDDQFSVGANSYKSET
jgi:hypothetical protein